MSAKVQIWLRQDQAESLVTCLGHLVARHTNRQGGVLDNIDNLALALSKQRIIELRDATAAAIAKARGEP